MSLEPDEESASVRRRVVHLLGCARLPLDNEKACQAAVADRLHQEGVAFLREVDLGAGLGIIDFLVPLGGNGPRGVGVEIKIKGGRGRDIYRQLRRYAAADVVASLVLATGAALALPPLIDGKRCSIINLGRAWL